MLLYTCVESGDIELCPEAYSRLCATGVPKGYDHVNMVKYYAVSKEVDGLAKMLTNLKKMRLKLDGLSRNKAIAACISRGGLEAAEFIMMHAPCDQEADVVTFNTLMKGYARAGQHARCFELKNKMESSGVPPSAVTYGILLEVCVACEDMDGARQISQEIMSSRMQFNAVHCTSLLKGLISADLLDDAVDLLLKMCERPCMEPDFISYTTVLRAFGERGRTREQVELLDQQVRELEARHARQPLRNR